MGRADAGLLFILCFIFWWVWQVFAFLGERDKIDCRAQLSGSLLKEREVLFLLITQHAKSEQLEKNGNETQRKI